MKASILKLLSLVLVCFLLLPLVFSCGEENSNENGGETELQRFEKLSEKEKAFYILTNDFDIEKSRVDTTANISCKYMGYSLVASLVGSTFEMDTDEEYFLYSEETLSMTIAGSSQVVLAKAGYSDGKEFQYTATNGSGKGYYAETTDDAYRQKRKEQIENGPDDDFGLTQENCKTITCVQNSHGGWAATFTDIDKDSLGAFKKFIDMSFTGLIDSETLTGATLEVCISSNLKPVSIKIDFEFSDASTELTVEGKYTVDNDVELPKVDLTGYTKKSSLDDDSPSTGI